jgi:uncharacterized protein (DUF849 family)
MQRGPVIIEAAINGGTTKATNPNVPRTPDEITADALACFEAGAAIVHSHAEAVGEPEDIAAGYLAAWRPVLAERPDALWYPTVAFRGGRIDYTHVDLLAREGVLRLGLSDPGSVNLGATVDGVPVGGFVYANSFDEVGEQLALNRRHGLGPSIALFEPGFLRAALAWWRADQLPAGSMFKFYLATDRGLMGAPFGMPPTREALDLYLSILGDCPVPWAVSVVGGDVVASGLARDAVERGGHIHLGLEFFAGERTPTNAELIAEAVALCAEIGVEVATPAQTAEILGLAAPIGTGAS